MSPTTKAITNKDIIQSYIITSARYDFSVDEKRILYRIVELCQAQLEGKKMDKNFKIDQSLFGDCNIVLPVSSFLPDDNENYTRVKKALISLRGKTINCEDEDTWRPVGIIEKPVFHKKGFVSFEIQPQIFEAILDFSKGYRKLELQTAMSFNSIYAMRLYELLSGKTEPISYKIQDLKIMFELEKKYKETKDFIIRVIDSAKKELDAKSPLSFTYKKIKAGNKVVSLLFLPIKTKNVDANLDGKRIQKRVSMGWDLQKAELDYLKQEYKFENDELKHNRPIFKEASERMPDLLLFLSKKKAEALTKDNPKGWIINTLKSEVLKIVREQNELQEKQRALAL
jgi:plasmid replication initiation protein